MPALIDDPSSARIPSPPTAHAPNITARVITLRNSQVATILPFHSQDSVPPPLLAHLCATFNAEIEAGDTYPMLSGMTLDAFSAYWLQNFAAIMLLGDFSHASPSSITSAITAGNVEDLCMGTFYIKPNYPGRSSHICNGGFLVSPAHRGFGVGRLLGEAYIAYAPQLGYEYSVFNLVYETNVASMRIWDALGFERIGRVPGAGRLRSWPGRKVDAVVYGRGFGEVDGERPSGEPEVAGV